MRTLTQCAGTGSLRALWLADNPLALSQLYRMDVLACFPEGQQLLLDGRRHRRAEHETASLRAQVYIVPSHSSSFRILTHLTLILRGCQSCQRIKVHGSLNLRGADTPCVQI